MIYPGVSRYKSHLSLQYVLNLGDDQSAGEGGGAVLELEGDRKVMMATTKRYWPYPLVAKDQAEFT